jgi:hypothetical protein
MTIFGKRLSEYVGFAKVFLALILAVGVARLALSLGSVPNATAKWVSITVVIWIGFIYFAIKVHTTGFGTCRHLLPIYFLEMLAAQLVIVPAIILAILTGRDNIFSIPEFSFGADGKTWGHVAAHLFIGTTVGTLVGWLAGCLILFVTRKVTRKTPSAARA